MTVEEIAETLGTAATVAVARSAGGLIRTVAEAKKTGITTPHLRAGTTTVESTVVLDRVSTF
jgi:hypothetical protein